MLPFLLQALAAEPMMIILFFTIPLIFLFLFSRFRLMMKPYPPGPTGWPLIGNMMMMDNLTHRGLAKLAQKYGGILHLRMGFVHTVVVSSPDIARQVLQVQDNIFSNRPATIAITYLTYDRHDLVFANYGPFWRKMRKLFVTKLFSRKRADSWDSVRDEVERMIRIVGTNTGSLVNIGELAFRLNRDIIYRAAFGTSSDEGKDEFIKIMREFSKLFGAFNIVDYIPFLSWVGVDPQGLNKRLQNARASLDRFINVVIDDHINKNKIIENASNDTDMVDELLAFYGHDMENIVSESDGLHNSIKLTRDNIKAIIMDVMFGGTETVALVIEWLMSELMRNPEDLNRVHEELNDVVGIARKVQETDLKKLTYFQCCLKETLRLHPPIPLLLHETAKPTEVSGYWIPAKSRVIINVWAIGRDNDSWKDPETFRPSRFLEQGVPDYRGSYFEFLPFGSGRRSCPGMQLGCYALEMTVVNLLHCFTWELANGMKPSELDMTDVFGLATPRATRLVAVPSPRLLCKL